MEARPPFAVKLLPSLADFAFLMPIVYLFGQMEGVKTLLEDCDTGWHIRTGDWILANGWVPMRDMFSFSKPGAPWFAWEWLTDILFAKLNVLGGLQAVAMFSILLICITFGGLFLLVRRKANPIVAIGVTMLVAAASSVHWLARPHLFTLLFLVLFYAALEQVREGRTRILRVPVLAALPVIMILWTNLHGGFFVGALMIMAYGAGEILNLLFSASTEGRRPALLRARAYFLSAFACLAASLINPYGYRLHAHMAQYLADPWKSLHIVEFLSPTFHHPAAIFFEVMLVMAVAASVSYIRRGQFTEPLLMVVWAHGALLAGRNIPIFMIAAALPVAACIQQWLLRIPESSVAAWLRSTAQKFNRIDEETGQTDSIARLHLVSVLGVLLVAALIFAPHPSRKFRAEFSPKSFPAAALETLRSDPGARIFTFDQWGDYLIYSLFKTHKVFIDGRNDFYGNDFEDKCADVLNVRYGWQKTLARFGVDTILMPPNAPLTGALKESRDWRVVYDDGVSLVFRSQSKTVGTQVSATSTSGGAGRDRKITKTEASDLAITETKPKT